MTKEELFAIMKGTIIVSCQATPGEPLYDKERSVMPLMARAAKQAGAKMIRTSSVRDIVGVKEETGLPVIGLIKREYPGYTGRITMTMREVDECVEAMADIVSIDCTNCTRGDSLTPAEFLKKVKAKYPNMIIMADCATYEEAVAAYEAGADLVGTTMNGYTPQTARPPEGRPQFRAGGTAGERPALPGNCRGTRTHARTGAENAGAGRMGRGGRRCDHPPAGNRRTVHGGGQRPARIRPNGGRGFGDRGPSRFAREESAHDLGH